MLSAARIGLVGALTVAMSLGVNNPAGVGVQTAHGCGAPWVKNSADTDASSLTDQSTEVFDDFNGPAGAPPDPGKWTVVEGKGWDRGDQIYAAANAVLDGRGHLMLRATKTDAGYTSGRIETRRKASFGYGTLMARMKMPSGNGLWPGFWLVGADEATNPWPGAGEIDVVEQVSDARKRYSSLHGPIDGVPDYLQAQIVGHGPDLSADFHDYWVTRAEDLITVGIDNVVWGSFSPESLPATAQGVYNKSFCAIFNLAVGGDWAGPPDSSTMFPATMLIDWVHWQPAQRAA